jgi:SAM-dependent methyltransferase
VTDTIDMNARMREGHPHLREAHDMFLPMLEKGVRSFGRPVRIFELGCASGILTKTMLALFPDAEIVANEEYPELVTLAREQLAGTRAELYTGPLSRWERPIDILVSGGSHHHLPHDYLEHAFRLIVPGGAYLMGDEFCPEYLYGEHAQRLARCEALHFCDGFILTTAAERDAYQATKEVPPMATEAERLRKRALWHWYRFVVDHAMERDFVDVAIGELKSTHDDLITGSEDEHKYCPSIFERQMDLAGFIKVSRLFAGPPDDPKLQSFFLYHYEKPVAT